MKSLIVEDDFLARSLLSKLLADFGVCHTVVNGAEAVKTFAKALEGGVPYDLICLDIMMPVMDGHQALLEIRGLEQKSGFAAPDGVKVIIVTAIDDSRNVAKAFRQGHCDAYLTKPVNRDKLLEQIRELGLIP